MASLTLTFGAPRHFRRFDEPRIQWTFTPLPNGGLKAQVPGHQPVYGDAAKRLQANQGRGAAVQPAQSPMAKLGQFAMKFGKGAAQGAKSVGKAAITAKKAVKGVVEKGFSKLPPAAQQTVSLVWSAMNVSYSAANAAVKAVAKEHGLSEQSIETLSKWTSAADWTLGAKLGAFAGGAIGGTAGAAVGSMIPVGSLAYLAYATSKDPQATIRAARAKVRGILAKFKKPELKSDDYEVQESGGKAPEFKDASEADHWADVHTQRTGAITHQELQASDWYRHQGDGVMNGALRGKGLLNKIFGPRGKAEEGIKALDSLIEKSTIDHDATLHRGLRLYGDPAKLFREGSVIADPGYWSTSLHESVAKRFMRNADVERQSVHLKIDMPAGFSAYHMPRVVGKYDEAELVLPRNSKFRVKKLEKIKDPNFNGGAEYWVAHLVPVKARKKDA